MERDTGPAAGAKGTVEDVKGRIKEAGDLRQRPRPLAVRPRCTKPTRATVRTERRT